MFYFGALVAYLVDRYVPGWEGTAWWFVIGFFCIYAGTILWNFFITDVDFSNGIHGDIPSPVVWMLVVNIIGPMFVLAILAPTLLPWVLAYGLVAFIYTFFMMSKA